MITVNSSEILGATYIENVPMIVDQYYDPNDASGSIWWMKFSDGTCEFGGNVQLLNGRTILITFPFQTYGPCYPSVTCHWGNIDNEFPLNPSVEVHDNFTMSINVNMDVYTFVTYRVHSRWK